MTDSIKIVENGTEWFLSGDPLDLNELPAFCTRCHHMMLRFMRGPANTIEHDATGSSPRSVLDYLCGMALPSPPSLNRVHLNDLHHSHSNSISPLIFHAEKPCIRLCYTCDFVHMGTRVCPFCKRGLTTILKSPLRCADYCAECALRCDQGRSLKAVLDEVRNMTNRRCQVCDHTESFHAASMLYVRYKHPFTFSSSSSSTSTSSS